MSLMGLVAIGFCDSDGSCGSVGSCGPGGSCSSGGSCGPGGSCVPGGSCGPVGSVLSQSHMTSFYVAKCDFWIFWQIACT